MSANRCGIAVSGSAIVDKINEISAFPDAGQLTKIHNVTSAVGGCVPNVATDIKRISPDCDVKGICLVGRDDDGKYIQKTLSENGVDVSRIRETDKTTSFTQVMSVVGGQRTFFTYAGADGMLTADDIDFTTLGSKILHLGYFLLLDKVDSGEGYKILKRASEQGIETSIDLVSENSDRYSLVLPCLPYTDYLIINELEAGKLTGMEPTKSNLRAICDKLKNLGVRKKVIIHMKDMAVCRSESGFTAIGSVDIPRELIKGTTGAGDAFCAGALVGIYEGMADSEILEFASECAAVSLTSADATGGLVSADKIREFCKNFGRMEVCL